MSKKLSVLVIDDCADDRMLYERTLKNAFNDEISSYLEASNGIKGLEYLSVYSPDCVLLDYSLPGQNGLEILKEI